MLSRRLRKTLPPYVIWSVFYAAALGHMGALGVLKALLTGGAAAHMYFLFVYAQLVVLTPLIYKCLRACRPLVYAVTPVSLVAYEVAIALGAPPLHLGRLFLFWMLFYVVGLDWRRLKGLVEGRFGTCVAIMAACLCLQFAEGSCWNVAGNYNMATTQVKLSSMACSLAVIAVFMTMPGRVRSWASGSLLTRLGDVSFGVYLCHMAILALVGKALGFLLLPVALATLLKWGLTLGLSCVFCAVVSKVLPRKVAGWIGF